MKAIHEGYKQNSVNSATRNHDQFEPTNMVDAMNIMQKGRHDNTFAGGTGRMHKSMGAQGNK